jgi:SAM-dependent methyltransferase
MPVRSCGLHGRRRTHSVLHAAPQGVIRWPREGRNHTALVDELDLPLPDRSVDRVLLVHAIECTEQVRPFLREIWRVMADGGKLITVAPTRAGLWSQLDRSPFYQGHPYSPRRSQASCAPTCSCRCAQTRALFMPPTRSRLAMRMAPAVERFGERWLGRFAGVSVIESGKQLYAGIAERHTQPELAVVRPKLRIAIRATRRPRATQRTAKHPPRDPNRDETNLRLPRFGRGVDWLWRVRRLHPFPQPVHVMIVCDPSVFFAYGSATLDFEEPAEP